MEYAEGSIKTSKYRHVLINISHKNYKICIYSTIYTALVLLPFQKFVRTLCYCCW